MRDDDQQIIKFSQEKNFGYNDFFISKANEHIIKFFDKWPNWEKKFLNISGEKFSGKSHLINISLHTQFLSTTIMVAIICSIKHK